MGLKGLKPYKPKLLHVLNADDPDRRIEFCEWIIDTYDEDPALLDRILWTDEAISQTNGRVNRHNCVYGSDTNPHLVIEQELHAPRLIVWEGIWSNEIVGPFIFEDNVASNNDLQILKNNVVPAVLMTYLKTNHLLSKRNLSRQMHMNK